MLNDLFFVERDVTAHGVELIGRHPDIKGMAKGQAFRVRLNAIGQIAEVEIVPEAGNGVLWTLRRGQQNGFPGLKTARGLLSLGDQDLRDHKTVWDKAKDPTVRGNEIVRMFSDYPLSQSLLSNWPKAGYRQQIDTWLTKLRSLSADPLTAAVPAAFERFLVALEATPSFIEELTPILAERARNWGVEWVELVRVALTGPVVLTIDVVDGEFPRDAGDPRQIGRVTDALSVVSTTSSAAGPETGQCAFSGQRVGLHKGNFPEPNLPSQGQVKLFSRNRDIPSLCRYGKLGDASFPIAADLLGRLSGAIKYLTGPELHNRTWRRIPGERLISQNGKKVERWDLLIASLPAWPDVPVARDIAGEEDDEGDEASPESAFKELATRVIDQSRAKYEHALPEVEVNVLILRKIDKGNHKAIYHRNTASKAMFEAAQRWKAATSNAPDRIRFGIWTKNKDGKPTLALKGPLYVAPLSIAPLSRAQFVNGGGRRVDVIGVTTVTAFGIFLHEGNVKQRARDVLRLLLRRHAILLSSLSQMARKGHDNQGTPYLESFDPKTDLRRDALRAVTWIGALLHQLGRLREVYMSDAGFRLGQVLAAADAVHIGYCIDVRNGSIPSTLLGNAVLGMAASNPQKALELLLRRWPPYSAWIAHGGDIFAKADEAEDSRGKTPAQQKQGKSHAIALRNAVAQANRVRPIATELKEQLRLRVDPPDGAFRAELLLGYMAGIPPVPKKNFDSALGTQDRNSKHQNEGE